MLGGIPGSQWILETYSHRTSGSDKMFPRNMEFLPRFPKMGVPKNGWFSSGTSPTKMDDLGIPLNLRKPSETCPKLSPCLWDDPQLCQPVPAWWLFVVNDLKLTLVYCRCSNLGNVGTYWNSNYISGHTIVLTWTTMGEFHCEYVCHMKIVKV